MRIATFNVQNLRLREGRGGPHLDGARNEVLPLARLSDAAKALDARDRALTAQLIADTNADVLMLQEVFDHRTLDYFNDTLLAPLDARYPRRYFIPGNDGRRHLALMSRAPLADVQSHASLSYDDIAQTPPPGREGSSRVFSRDCLTASYGGIWLLNVHFKAPADGASLAVTRLEALAVRRLIEQRFAKPAEAHWIIIGDVNVGDVPVGDVLEVLTKDFAVDLSTSSPLSERWTYFHASSGSYARPDRVLASPVLAARQPRLIVQRQGVSRAAQAYTGLRFDDVGAIRPRASDHVLLAVDLNQE